MWMYNVDLKQCVNQQSDDGPGNIVLLRHILLDAPRIVQVINLPLRLVAVSVPSRVSLEIRPLPLCLQSLSSLDLAVTLSDD